MSGGCVTTYEKTGHGREIGIGAGRHVAMRSIIPWNGAMIVSCGSGVMRASDACVRACVCDREDVMVCVRWRVKPARRSSNADAASAKRERN